MGYPITQALGAGSELRSSWAGHSGVSRNNAVAVPEGKFPLKVAFVLAESDLARTVPPHGMRRWRANQEDYYGMAIEDAGVHPEN